MVAVKMSASKKTEMRVLLIVEWRFYMVVVRMSDSENIIQQKIRGPIAGVYIWLQDK